VRYSHEPTTVAHADNWSTDCTAADRWSLGRLSATDFDLWWHVIAGGGGHSSSADHALDGSVGQPAVGGLSSTDYRLGAGYLYGVVEAAPPPPAYKNLSVHHLEELPVKPEGIGLGQRSKATCAVDAGGFALLRQFCP